LYSSPEGLCSGGKDGLILWWNTSLKAIGAGMDFKDKCFDCASSKPRITSVCFAHDGVGNGNKALVGTRSGEIFEIEQSEGVSENETDQNHAYILRISKSHYAGELWGLATHPHKQYFVTCGDDKTVRLWDANLRRQKAFRRLPLKARGAAISPDGTRIALALWDGTVYILDGELSRVIKKVKDAKKWGSVIQYSPDGKTLAFGSHDRRIYLYNTIKDMYSKRAICKGHSSYITALDFTTDSRHLQSTCGAYELLYWTIGGNRVTSAAAMRDQKWETWTCTLGWPVQGIWPAGADGTDINSCARSHSRDLIVSGDDFGQVRMMRYPCLDLKCGDRSYDGHAQHVMGTRFTFDDSHVLSTGGGDRCIFQWACEYEEEDDHHDNDFTLGAYHHHDNKEDEIDVIKIEHRTRLQEAGRAGGERDVLAEIFEEQSQQGGDEFMAVKPWLGTITRMKPKDFDPRSISNDAPDVDMDLSFVFGYRGSDSRNNLRYTAKGEVCYPAAALGIVYDPKASNERQRFFDVHTDDVLSLAMHPQGKVVATGEIGRTPKIVVWDTDTLETLAVLKGFHKRGVPLLAFSEGRGDRLASVGLDNDHSIAVYAWEQKVCLATSKGSKSQIFGIRFGKDINTLVTCGVRHVSFWEIKGTTLKSQKGLFGRKRKGQGDPMQTAVTIGSINHSKNGPMIVTGMANGQIYTWDKHKLPKNGMTPKFQKEGGKPKGQQMTHSQAVTSMWSHSDGLISGSKDGTIIMWKNDDQHYLVPTRIVDVEQLWWILEDPTTSSGVSKEGGGNMQKKVLATWSEDNLSKRMTTKDKSIQSLSMKDGKLLIGTKGCEIIELDTSDLKKPSWNLKEGEIITIPSPIMHAHCSGETWGLAVHPGENEERFITCGDDKKANLWHIYDRYLINSVDLKKKARSVAISLKPLWSGNSNPEAKEENIHHVAFGLFNGQVVVHRDDLSTSELGDKMVIASFHCCKEWIQDMKFSPDNKMLAVSSHDNMIYVIDIDMEKKMYHSETMAVCKGHSSYISHIDFSSDSKYLQSTCGAYELLFWDLKRRKTIKKTGKIRIQQETHVSKFATRKDNKGIKWNTFTVPLGWDVQGIWPPNVDGTDINAVERSHGNRTQDPTSVNGNLIALADDFGMVKLMRYPCVSNSQLSKSYRGHSAHVTNVVFHNDDSFVISTGGGDNCVFVWTTDYVPADDVEQSSHLQAHKNGHDDDDHGHGGETKDIHGIGDEMDQLMGMSQGGGDEFMAVKPWLGAISEPSSWCSNSDSFDEPPSELELQFVYGFSSKLRNSVYFDKRGNYIYASAATGVVYNPNKHTQRFNRTLTDDILSCSLSPDGNTCAMGEQGRKPKICIWDVHSGNTLMLCGGFHRRGVTLLAWSPSGRMLASIGLDNDHSLAVYDAETGDLIASSKGHQSKVLGLLFKSETEIIIVGVKHAKFFTLKQRRLKGKGGIFGKKGKLQPILCVASLGTNVVTGQADGTLYLWQGRNCQMKTEQKKSNQDGGPKGHRGPVTSIWTMAREGVISGGRDGIVIVWDRTLTELKRFDIKALPSAPRAGLNTILPCGVQSICCRENQILVATESAALIVFSSDDTNVNESDTNSVITGHFKGETWGLARHPSKAEFVTCGDDKTVRRWDSAHQRSIKIVLLDAKARAVAYAPDAAHIAVGLFSGRVEIFDSDLNEKIKGISVCREWIQDLKYSPDKKHLAVSSHDNHIYIFDRKTYMRTAIMKGHSSYITHIDFSANSKYLQTNCGAYELLFWDVRSGKQIKSASSLRDERWETWTCTLGWPVQGIWPAEADGTDVNAVDRSPNDELLVTADDFGKVKLFRYPAPKTKGCEYRTSIGHSSHVTNVRFLHDGQTVISTGGNDRCIFHWDVGNAKVRHKRRAGGKGRRNGGGSEENPPAPQAQGGRRPPKPRRRRRR
jgi:microtubule-associated protein-like 6